MQKVTILKPERFQGEHKMTGEVLENAVKEALKKIDQLMEEMGDDLPGESSVNNVYPAVKNDWGWQGGFYAGMLWLAYEITGDEKYKKKAESLIDSFYVRIKEKLGVNHHDMGFLYMPSCVAAYKLTGNEKAKEAALMAADHLMGRYNAGVIQAWGNVGDNQRLIVDCMNNIPLLYWATEETGDMKYWEAAKTHAWNTMKYTIREDGSTFHTFHFDKEGNPLMGETCQGAADDSTWARGHAWGVLGFPIAYSYTGDEHLIDLHRDVTYFLLNHLPEDLIPNWDLIFTKQDEQPRDSSTGVIAACGMMEMCKYLPDDAPQKKIFESAAAQILEATIDKCTGDMGKEYDGVIYHTTASLPHDMAIDECAMYGDYFYLEAIMRYINPDWKRYW